MAEGEHLFTVAEVHQEPEAVAETRAKEDLRAKEQEVDPKKNPNKQQDGVASVLQSPTESNKRTQKKKKIRDNRKRQKELQDTQEQPVSYHGDDVVKFLNDDSDDSDSDGAGQIPPDTYAALKGVASESVHGPSIHGSIGETGGHGTHFPPGPPGSPEIIEQAGTGAPFSDGKGTQDPPGTHPRMPSVPGLTEPLGTSSEIQFQPPAAIEFRPVADATDNPPSTTSLGERIMGMLPKGFKWKTPFRDDVAITIDEEQPAVQGDTMNFISQFGSTEEQVTVKKERGTEFTMIRSSSGSSSNGGVRMMQEMDEKWNYFEVMITRPNGDGAIGIGVGHKNYPLYHMPGWEDGSIGYHADDGGLFNEDGYPQLHGPRCTKGDRMGCGVDFTQSGDGHVHVWFTKNDQVVIKPDQMFELPVDSKSKLYPLVCMTLSGQEVRYLGHWHKSSPRDPEITDDVNVAIPFYDEQPIKQAVISDLDDVIVSLSEEQPVMQGDRVINLISQFGAETTEQQMTITTKKQKGTEFTHSMIRSQYGSSNHSGVRMKQAMNQEWNYFEVLITNTVGDGEIGIGVGHKNYPLFRMPGWDDDSIGYHADDGGVFHEFGFPLTHGPPCTKGDRMGCGVDFSPSSNGHVRVWFTKNDQVVMKPRNMKLPVNSKSKLYPLIGMKWPGQEVRYLGHCKKPLPVEDVGDRVNLISQFGTTEQQVTVKKQRGTKFTIIRSQYGGYRHGGVRMKQAMNPEWNYFEVTITDTIGDGEIGIGVGHKNYPLYQMPGWDDGSIGYHADDGGLYHEDGFPKFNESGCTIGDRMGCGVDFTPIPGEDGLVRVWFTKNGQVVISPQIVKLPIKSDSMLYPLICMEESGQEVQYMGHWQNIPPTDGVGRQIQPPTLESAGHVDPERSTTDGCTNLITCFGTTEVDIDVVAVTGGITLLSSCNESNGIASVKINQEMSEKWNYFEVKIRNTVEAGEIGIGIGHKNYPLSKMPGWGNRSIGYHADDGGLYHEHGSAQVYGPTCLKGDRMGCGVDFTPCMDGHVRVWFTKNDQVVFALQTVELPVTSESKFYPLLSMRGSGQKVQYNGHCQKPPPKKVVPIPWWQGTGFESEEKVPFYTKDASIEKYGRWESTTDLEVDQRDFEQFHRSCLKQFRDVKNASECMKKAEDFFKKHDIYEADHDLVELKASNGNELDASDRVILFFARMLISAAGKEEAFPYFMSIGGWNNTIMNMTMIGALLYMGCPTNHFLKRPGYLHVFLNWEANPDVRDRDGKTALHLHTHLGSVKMLVHFKADVDLKDSSGDTPLHIAARNGRTAVAELLLQHHASTSIVNNKNETALDIAAVHENLECFKTIFTHATKNERIKHQSGLQKWKKLASKEGQLQHEQLDGLSQVQIYCATVSKTEQDWKPSVPLASTTHQDQVISVQRLVSEAVKCDTDLTPQLLTKIFDACIFGHKLVITDILEADLDGNLPNTVTRTITEGIDGQGSKEEKHVEQETSLLPYLSDRPKLFFKLAKHPTLKEFVKVQWRRQANCAFWFRFLYYLFKMVVLTFALVIAARPELTDDQLNKYPDPLDYFRGICEVLFILMTLVKIGEEAAEIAVSQWSYLKDWTNYIEWLYIVFTLLIIPFRALNHPGQWIVASLAYFLNGIKIVEFIALFQWTGAYLQTLRIIITRDIVRFMTVFLILLVLFSGGLYLSLRYDDSLAIDPGSNITSYRGGDNADLQSLDGEGRLLHELYFTGLRALIEAGSVLDYYGPSGGFRALSVIIYLLFLFIVVIILLNVLIAQVSDTYTKVLSTAEGVYLYHQCRYIARLEAQNFSACLLYDIFKRCCCRRHATHSQGCMFPSISSKQRQWPNVIWIGKKRSQGKSQWQFLKKKFADFFKVYAFDEDDDLGETKVEADTSAQKLEGKLELEHRWFEDKMNKMEEVLADMPNSTAVSQFVEGESDKLKGKLEFEHRWFEDKMNKMEEVLADKPNSTTVSQVVEGECHKLKHTIDEQVGELAEQLTNKITKQLDEMKCILLKEQPEHTHEARSPVQSDVGEEPRYQEATPASALHVSSMLNIEEEVRKLASQLQEVKALLLKEQPKYSHSPSTQEPSHPVPGGKDGEPIDPKQSGEGGSGEPSDRQF